MNSTCASTLSAALLSLALVAPCAGQSRMVDLARRPQERFANGVMHSQRESAVGPARLQPTAGTFLVEWIGGTAGSLIGVGVMLLIASPDECNNEDLACILERLGAAGIASVIGAPVGTVVAGRMVGGRPSVPGAILGSIAGAAGGIGLLRLMEEVDDDPPPLLFTLTAYTGVHGLFTALGSRIGAALRN